jgi:spermidine synthase
MALLLVPSGCAALIYQVTWVRLLGLSMGSTSAAVSTVLTAFFLGMAIGSFLAGKILRDRQLGMAPFLLLELFIGLSGVLLLPVLLSLDHVMALLGSLGTSVPMKFLVSLAVLAVPTICMGATFPVLAAALITRQRDMGADVGRLYALNTAGAVLGALLAGFVLTPRLGLDGAIFVACTLNLSVVVAGLLIRRRLPAASGRQQISQTETSTDVPSANQAIPDAPHVRVAVVLFGTGFVAIACEVGWTKYLAIFTGATIYGFAAILGVFLIGIAAGSWAVKRYLKRRLAQPATLAWGLAILGAALLFSRVGLAQLPALLDYLNVLDASASVERGLKYLAVFVVLLPATFIFGGLFPISLSMYCARFTDLRRRIGEGYAINTIGSIFGAMVAGFWVIPAFGTDVLLTATVVAILALSWLFVDVHARRRSGAIALAVTAILLAASWRLPHLDYAELITAAPYRFDADAMAGKKPHFLFLEEGRAGVISVVTYDGKKAVLQNNGIQESFLGLDPAMEPPFTEMLLGLMPYLLHPDPESAFVIGFGGGNTVQALTDTPLQEIRVVELEPAVIAAVAAIQDGEVRVLQDARVELQINDARNSLLVERRSYDLIVSQPSHPWLAGAGNLFTREFFGIASASLNEGGIFAQWVNLFNMDATTLRSILQAYFDVFPHGFVFANTRTSDLLLFGSGRKLVFDYQRIQQRMRLPAVRRALSAAQVQQPEALLWYFAMSRDEALTAAGDMLPNTDTRIFSEVRLAGMTIDPRDEEDPYNLLRSNSSLDVIEYLNPEETARWLYLAGRYFYRYASTTRTRQAIALLESLDPPLAKRLDADWEAWRDSVRRRSTRPQVQQ